MALGEKILYLTDFWVEPAARGNGVGPELLKRALGLAAANNATRIVADLTSAQAIKATQKVFGRDAVDVFAAPSEEVLQGADSILPAAARLEYHVENQPPLNLAAATNLGM